MELEVRHLRVLLTVADTGSVSRAAATLGLSQPSLSAQLQRIERTMGIPLFERSPSGVEPTAYGRYALAKARTVLAELEELRSWTAQLEVCEQPMLLRIGAVPGPIAAKLALSLRRAFSSLRPENETEVYSHAEQSSLALLRMIDSDRLDVVVVEQFAGHELPVLPSVRRMELVAVEPVFVALGDQHPLSGKAEIDLADLAEESWIIDPLLDSGESAHLRRACQRAGFEPRIRHHATETTAARSFVASGQCVSLAQATSREGLGIVVRPLVGDPIVRRLDVAWSSERFAENGELVRLAAADAYLGLVEYNDSFARWWDTHPEAHPAIA
ncbi:LysR family transcriptional regulator [Allokutzneria multivorans]|uniref:LysR family transcriptional regulator n=1 Tax=Allokutzneria multivorans TaxID=1142134 RepID=UPI0031E9EF4E